MTTVQKLWPRLGGLRPHRKKLPLALALSALALAVPAQASAQGSGGVGDEPDPAETEAPTSPVPGAKAELVNGLAVAPESAPPKVVRAINAANKIVQNRPYCYGGGHSNWQSRCYDCSGTVSYALGKPGARVLAAPMPSGSFTRWEEPGRGKWITVYANGGHMYAVIAGLRLDTSMTAGEGPGWSKTQLRQSGFSVRHPAGL